MREEIRFPSAGQSIAAWLYRGGEGRRACVVMAHGFGGTRKDGLAPYAERFQQKGYHVLCFDYRYFGDSEGQPRQLLSIEAQLEDWSSAIAFARGLPEVDPARVALWGTSLGGGHVVVAGARDGRVAAIIAQCPMMDGAAVLRRIADHAGPAALARITKNGLLDAARARFGGQPLRIPIVGPPGSDAAMSTPDAEAGFRRIAASAWDNSVCARVALHLGLYRPFQDAARVPCPLLVQICELDSVAPVDAAERAAALAGAKATVLRYPVGHFDIYMPPAFDRAVADQISFLEKHLGRAPGRRHLPMQH